MLPDERERWTVLRTPGFVVFSQTADVTTRAIARRLEASRLVIRDLSGGRILAPATPTHVFAFRSGLGFRRYGGKAARNLRTVGIFTEDGVHGYAMALMDLAIDPLEVIHHEDLHAVTRRNFARAPLWFHEGVAEFYSTFRIERDLGFVGLPPEGRLGWLRKNGPIDLVEVFAVRKVAHDDEGSAGFYATSWALVHYLLKGDREGRASLVRFLELSASRPALDAFREAFGREPAELGEEIRGYVNGETFRYTEVPIDSLALPEIADPVVLPRADLLLSLGELALKMAKDADLAEAHFLEASRLAPESVGWRVGLAGVEALRGRWDAAAALFDEAVVLAPDDPSIACRAGMNDVDASRETVRAEGELPDDAPLRARIGRARLARCLAAYPDLVDALVAFGSSFVFETRADFCPGLDALEAAHRLAPDRREVLYVTATVASSAGEFERAVEALELAAERFGSPGEIRKGRAAVAAQMFRHADRKREAGDLEGALVLFRRAADLTPLEDQRLFLEDLVARLSDRLERERKRRESERLEPALDLVRRGQNAKAIPRLREFLRDCSVEEVCRVAKDLLDEILRLERSKPSLP